MLVIPSGGSTDRQHIEPTFRAAEVFRPVTKWSTMVHSPREIPNALRRAYQAMRSGKPGPVMVEVSKDVFEEEFEGALSYTPVPKLRTAPDPDAIADAARLLLSAKNPLLWAGQGVIYAEAGDRLLALAEMLPAPIVCTNPGKSAVPDSHPLALGAAAHSRSKMFTDYLKRADLVCAIGSSLTRTPFGPGVPSGKKIIHCTNEARDINKDYDVDYALVGDAALVIDALIAEVGRQKKGESGKALTVLMDEIAQTKKAWQAEWTKHFESNEVPINQYRVLGELMKHVDRSNTIVTHDSGSPREQTLPFWETTKAGTYMGWGKSTQLGYGLGITIGAKLAAPDKLCMNIMRDCSFGMTGMDIETASRNGIAILTVVFNNGVMACERSELETSTAKYGALTVGGNYAKLAEALNVPSRRVEKPADIAGAIKEAVQTNVSGRPFLIEIIAKEGYDFSRYS